MALCMKGKTKMFDEHLYILARNVAEEIFLRKVQIVQQASPLLGRVCGAQANVFCGASVYMNHLFTTLEKRCRHFIYVVCHHYCT